MKTGEKLAMWWLKHYDETITFWRGFNWTLIVGLLLTPIVGAMSLETALVTMFVTSAILNISMILTVKTLRGYLRNLTGSIKEEAHDLMIGIMKRISKKGL